MIPPDFLVDRIWIKTETIQQPEPTGWTIYVGGIPFPDIFIASEREVSFRSSIWKGPPRFYEYHIHDDTIQLPDISYHFQISLWDGERLHLKKGEEEMCYIFMDLKQDVSIQSEARKLTEADLIGSMWRQSEKISDSPSESFADDLESGRMLCLLPVDMAAPEDFETFYLGHLLSSYNCFMDLPSETQNFGWRIIHLHGFPIFVCCETNGLATAHSFILEYATPEIFKFKGALDGNWENLSYGH